MSVEKEINKNGEIWAQEECCPECGWDINYDERSPYTVTDEKEFWQGFEYAHITWNEHFICPKCQTKFILVNEN